MMDRIFVTNRMLKLGFGRCPDASIADVLHDSPMYLLWCMDNIDWFDLHHAIYEEALGIDELHLQFMFAVQGI